MAKAGGVEQALQLLDDLNFDLVISDIGMPGQDGYELMRELRQREQQRRVPRVPTIALTAYARPEDRRRALVAGFQSHIAKPVDRGELLALVASLTGRV